jgi:D-alanine transaminase
LSRIAYVNGRYQPHGAARVHIEDRGYQFADGVYEVFAVYRGVIIDEERHFERLQRSLGETRIAWPVAPASLRAILHRMIRLNRLDGFGSLYLQITRGVAPRNHPFPAGVPSALVVTARRLPPIDRQQWLKGVTVITAPDWRWYRRDIKSVALLPNVLGKQQAIEAGAYESWLITPEQTVTEGTASNAWIVGGDGALITHPADHAILNGVTRLAVLDTARQLGMTVAERPFTLAEALTAREAFLTSTTSLIRPVVAIDGTVIGAGAIGPCTEALLRGLWQHFDDQARVRQ